MKQMKKQLIPILIVLFTLLGCGKKSAGGKNMEQIQKEEGIPVRVTELQTTTYNETYTYNATLTGIEESTITAMVSDVVTKINVKVGDFVQKDQIIISFPKDTPSAQYQQANSAFINARTTYERMQRLYAQGAISQQDMDNMETAYTVSLANYNTSQSMVNVKAPFSGYLTNLFVNVGDKVNYGTELFTVSNTNKYKAVIWIPDSEIQNIRKGQKALAYWNDEILNGQIFSVALAMDQNKKAFRAEVIFNTKTKYIASGVTVSISINVKSIPNTIVIDRNAMIESEGKHYVWTVIDNKALRKEIKVGQNNGIRYQVTEGLTAGEKLITEGMTMVYEGGLIKVIQ